MLLLVIFFPLNIWAISLIRELLSNLARVYVDLSFKERMSLYFISKNLLDQVAFNDQDKSFRVALIRSTPSWLVVRVNAFSRC